MDTDNIISTCQSTVYDNVCQNSHYHYTDWYS